MAEVKIIASPTSWIEGEAIAQLERIAKLPDMIRAVGLPDLHPGRGCPVGAAFVTENRIYPHLVGSDIGCGMGLWTTSIKRPRPERLEKKLKRIEGQIDHPEQALSDHCVEPCGHEHSLGTIGRGNHFAEIQMIDEILDQDELNTIIDPEKQENAVLLVHSGSRGYGEQILYAHTAKYRDEGLAEGTPDFDAYMVEHDHAVAWAEVNRRVIAQRILDCLGANGDRILDVPHNFVEAKLGDFSNEMWFHVHRKGAIPSDRGAVVIPGSRGAMSYLVEPTQNLIAQTEAGWSLSHGAGRKMSRKDALQKAKGSRRDGAGINQEHLKRTKLGSLVICDDQIILKEEIPEAYKPIARVIEDLVEHNLVKVIATLKPVLTYKMRQHNNGK